MQMAEIPKLIEFSRNIMERQISLYEAYHEDYSNIYRPRVA